MTAFWMALSMFSVFPSRFVWEENRRQEMLLWFPAVGVLIGFCWSLAAWFAQFLSLRFLSAAVLAVLPWMLSGYMHLDGFIDCADAYLSRASKEKKLQILKDSRVGAFALIAMVLLAMVSFAAFLEAELCRIHGLLLFIPVVSRTVSAVAVLNFVPMAGSSYEVLLSRGVSRAKRILPLILLAAELAAAFLLCGKTAIVLAPELAAGLLVIWKLKKNFGGMSGDISGCSIVLSELAAVLGLALTGGMFT